STDDPVSVDDPVRVYLREMGSVRLLTRQGEIELARRMDRGKFRVKKALSRSPLTWESSLALCEDVRRERARVGDFLDIAGQDEAAKAKTRAALGEQLATTGKLIKIVLERERKCAEIPVRHVNVRAKLERKLPRL